MSAYKIESKNAQLLLTECGIPCDDPAKVKGRLESLPDMAKGPAFATVATEGVAWGPASVAAAVGAARAGAPFTEVGRLDGEPR